jgi:hypothetical protein
MLKQDPHKWHQDSENNGKGQQKEAKANATANAMDPSA